MGTLYERLGGEAAVHAAVVRFYEKVMADTALAPFFADLDLDAQVRKQVSFMTMAFGGPIAYSGRSLRKAHADLVARGMGDAHFDGILRHLGSTLGELGIDAHLTAEVLALVEAHRADVLSR